MLDKPCASEGEPSALSLCYPVSPKESTFVAGVSKLEAATLVLRGKRLAALSMGALADQCSSRAEHTNTDALQHATQESLVSCIEGFIGVLTQASILPFGLPAQCRCAAP